MKSVNDLFNEVVGNRFEFNEQIFRQKLGLLIQAVRREMEEVYDARLRMREDKSSILKEDKQ